MKYLIPISLIFVGCIMSPEHKKVRIINVDCRDSFSYADSAGYHYECAVIDSSQIKK